MHGAAVQKSASPIFIVAVTATQRLLQSKSLVPMARERTQCALCGYYSRDYAVCTESRAELSRKNRESFLEKRAIHCTNEQTMIEYPQIIRKTKRSNYADTQESQPDSG